MDRSPAPSPGGASSTRVQDQLPRVGGDPPPVAHLTRPDGRLQVGQGTRGWLVEGWLPSATSAQEPATTLVRGLVGEPAPGRRLTPYRVVGRGELAAALRRELGAALGEETPDGVVVLVCDHVVPVGTARRADLVSTQVLPVVAQTGRVVMGPWTGLPGGPCLHCLDLHRTDHDPEWPVLAAALDDPLTSPLPPRQHPCVTSLVVGLTTLLVTTVRREARDGYGLAYEAGPSRPHLVTRRWSAHPACPWHLDRPGPDG